MRLRLCINQLFGLSAIRYFFDDFAKRCCKCVGTVGEAKHLPLHYWNPGKGFSLQKFPWVFVYCSARFAFRCVLDLRELCITAIRNALTCQNSIGLLLLHCAWAHPSVGCLCPNSNSTKIRSSENENISRDLRSFVKCFALWISDVAVQFFEQSHLWNGSH